MHKLQGTLTDLLEKKQTTPLESGEGYEQILFKRRHLCSQQTHEKLLIITGH